MKGPIGIILLFLCINKVLHTYLPPIDFEMDDYLGVLNDTGNGQLLTVVYDANTNAFKVYDINSEDPNHNRYDRGKLYSDIRSLIDYIRIRIRYRELRDGFYWNIWREWIVLFRTKESDKFEKYLDYIYDNCENLSTRKLLHVKKELYRFWRGLKYGN